MELASFFSEPDKLYGKHNHVTWPAKVKLEVWDKLGFTNPNAEADNDETATATVVNAGDAPH